jgi:membrane fusion protein
MTPTESPPAERKPLFRVEALQTATTRRYGAVVLATPLSFGVLAGIAALVAVSVVTFFVAFDYQRKVQVAGVLLPESGLMRVVSPQGGVIVQRKVREGAVVVAGTPLFVVSNERFSTTLGDATKGLSSLLQVRKDSLIAERQQLLKQSADRGEALERRASDLQAEIARNEDQVRLQQRRVGISEEAFKRFSNLQSDSFVSPAQVQDKQGELIDQQQRLADLKRLRAATARELDTVRAELNDRRIQSRRDEELVARNIAATEQDLSESEARRELVIRAPQDGVVSAINIEPGQTIAAGVPLAYILPQDARLQAELYAPSKAAGFLKPGMAVMMRYQAYPYQKFGQHRGQVIEVSNSAVRPEELTLPGALMPANATGEPLYRLRVQLDEQAVTAYGTRQPLRSGMLLEASILLERRPLYQWVLEPLYTVTGRF